LDIPDVALVLQYDAAMASEDYVHRIGRTGRIGKSGISIALINNRSKGIASELIAILNDAKMEVPNFLKGMAISSGTYDPNATAAQAYGGQDVRATSKKGFMAAEQKAESRRFGDFDKDAYGEGSWEKAQKVAVTVGPEAAGSYNSSVTTGKGSKKGKGKGQEAPRANFDASAWDGVAPPTTKSSMKPANPMQAASKGPLTGPLKQFPQQDQQHGKYAPARRGGRL